MLTKLQTLRGWAAEAVFLFHLRGTDFPVISIVFKAARAVDLHGVAVAAALSLCGPLSFAAALHHLVERPLQQFARLSKRARAVSGNGVQA